MKPSIQGTPGYLVYLAPKKGEKAP